MRQPVYTRKYFKKQTRKHHPEQPLWSKCRQLLGCKGNWWLNLAPPRSPDFSFVTEFLFRNILHLHTNPIFFSKMFLDFCQTEIPGSLQKMTPILRLCSEERPADTLCHWGNWGVYTPGSWCLRGGTRSSTQQLLALPAAPPQLVRHSTETLRLHSGRK